MPRYRACRSTIPLDADWQVLQDGSVYNLSDVEHFFATYEQLAGVHIQTQEWAGRETETAALLDRFGRLNKA